VDSKRHFDTRLSGHIFFIGPKQKNYRSMSNDFLRS